jgi:hypothetical protein
MLPLHRVDADVFAPVTVFELHLTFDHREDGVVLAKPNIATGAVLCTTLAQDYITRDDVLTTVALDAQALGIAVTAVAGRTSTFLMRHDTLLLLFLSVYLNSVNSQPCVLLPVTLTAAIALARPVLPDKDLLSLVLFDDRCCHGSARDGGLADLDIVTICQKQDIVQNDLLTDFAGQLFDAEKMANFGAVLPTATFYNCVHG